MNYYKIISKTKQMTYLVFPLAMGVGFGIYGVLLVRGKTGFISRVYAYAESGSPTLNFFMGVFFLICSCLLLLVFATKAMSLRDTKK